MAGDSRDYGDAYAEFYDWWWSDVLPYERMAAKLAELSGTGPVLELGIGTGNAAVPLAKRGIEVVGIDASNNMLERLAAKGASGVTGIEGDFKDFELGRKFSLAYCVFSTFFMLTDQASQVRAFERVAKHLETGGAFALETTTRPFGGRKSAEIQRIDGGKAGVAIIDHDELSQITKVVQLLLDGAKSFAIPFQARYCSPGELDLMARIAGMSLESTWGGWSGEPLTASSPIRVAVYRRS